jgi:uncharacterized membrane protein YfcA
MKTETDKKAVISGGNMSGIGAMALSDLLNVTWRMTTPTILGIVAGYGIGALLGYRTAGFLVGAVLGFVTGLYMAYRLLSRVIKEEK